MSNYKIDRFLNQLMVGVLIIVILVVAVTAALTLGVVLTGSGTEGKVGF